MDRDCSHCGCHHTDIKFKSQLRRKRHLVNKVLEKEIGQSNIKWFDELTEESIQRRCSTTQVKTAATSNMCVENSPAPTRHPAELLHGLTPGGGSLTPLSSWALLATQDVITPKLYRPVLGISPAFVSTPKPNNNVKSCTDISKELGLDNSSISWTSSMATPCLKNDTVDLDDDIEDNSEYKADFAIRIKGFPRVLFTPDRAGCDSEDFGHMLEVTGDDDTLAECVSPDSGFLTDRDLNSGTSKTTPNKKPASQTNASPIVRRANKRLSLGTKSNLGQACMTPDKLDVGEITDNRGEMIVDVQSDTDVKEDDICDTQSCAMLSPSSTNSVIVSALSPFFDSPTSEQEKRRAAPKGVKRKAEEMISLDDELRMSSSSGSSQSLSPQGPPSILSSTTKRMASERKRVRFAADVEKSDKNSRLLRKRKSCSKDDTETVKKIQHQNVSSSALSLNTSSTCDLAMKIVNLNINNSCEGGTNESSADISDDWTNKIMLDFKSIVDNSKNFRLGENEDNTNTKESLMGEDKITEVKLCTDLQKKNNNPKTMILESRLSVKPVNDCLQANTTLTDSNTLKRTTSDELFSQVSPSAWKEMCLAANKETNLSSSEISETHHSQYKSVNLSTTVLDTGHEISETHLSQSKSVHSVNLSNTVLDKGHAKSDLCKHISESEKPLDLKPKGQANVEVKKTGILFKPRKFLYPSGSQISSVSPQRIFNFHNLKQEINRNADDVNPSTEDKDDKQNEEKAMVQEKTTDNVSCVDEIDLKRGLPRANGHDDVIKLKKTEQHFSPVKPQPKRRNSMGFTKFSEMFAGEMSETDGDTKEIRRPLKTLDSQIASKGKSPIHQCHSDPDACSVKQDVCLKSENIELEEKNDFVEYKTACVEMIRPSVNILSTVELYSSEEPEEKNDYDFDMSTQDVENFVKDAFLDDMEFSQISSKDSNSTVNKESVSRETFSHKTYTDNLLNKKSPSGTCLSKYVESTDKHSDNNVDRLKLSFSVVQAGDKNVEKVKSYFHVIDDEISVKCVARNKFDAVHKSEYLSTVNEKNSDDICKVNTADLSTKASTSISNSNYKHTKSNGDVLQMDEILPDRAKDKLGFLNCGGSSEISFPSFATASGKGVKFNKTALQKAQSLLEFEDDELKSLTYTNQNETYPSFTTASGRGVKLNKTALQKAQTLLECEDKELKSLNCINECETFPSFTTASGRGVKFNKTALQKAQGLLECEDKDLKSRSCTNEHETIPSFTTASGRGVKFNKTALQKAQSLLECEDKDLKSRSCTNEHETIPSFTTASGRGVKFNKTTLQKAQTLLECEDKELKSLNYNNEETFPSFTTAGGKGVKFNKTAIQKAQALLECEDKGLKSLNYTNESETIPSFTTASGRGVKFNKTAIQKAQTLLECEDDELRLLTSIDKKETPSFTTASDSGTKNNKTVMEKTQDCLGGEQDEIGPLKCENSNVIVYPSFSTASGKGMKCNQSALNKAQALLTLDDDMAPLKPSDSLSSFSKANGEQVKVNDDSLSKTLPPFHSEGDVCMDRPAVKHQLDSKQSNGQTDSESDNKIRKVSVDKKFINEREALIMLESNDGKIAQFNASETNTADNFEEMLDSILTSKKKSAKVKENVISMSKVNTTGIKPGFQTGFGTLNMKTSSFKTTNPMLKPKGFRPFKKPKLIAKVKSSELNPSKSNINQSSDDKDKDCRSPKQLQNVKLENKESTNTDETEMSEIMLNEFCHDIFSQCASQQLSPQNDKLTEDESTFSDVESVLEKSDIACPQTNFNVIQKITISVSHSEDVFQSVLNTQVVDNVRKCNLTENVDTQGKAEAKTGSKLHEGQMSEVDCFLGQGFQMASGKKIHVSENAILKANKILSDKNESHVEAFAESESLNLEENDCLSRQRCTVSRGTRNEMLNEIEEMQTSSLPLEMSESVSVRTCTDFHKELSTNQLSTTEEKSQLHLHPLLLDDTLFEDDMSNGSENRTKAKEHLLKTEEHHIPNSDSSYQPNEQDFAYSAVKNTSKTYCSLSNKPHLSRTNSKDESNASSCDVSEEVSSNTKVQLVPVIAIDPLVSEELSELISIPEREQEPVEQSGEDTSVSLAANDAKRKGSCMFQTASGRSVDISKKALEHAKSLWEKDLTVNTSNNSPAKESVSGSKDEVDHVLDWENEDMDVSAFTENDNTNVQDFHASSNKQVDINESVVQHIKPLKQKEPSLSVDKSNECNLFQTALGKTVGISKIALEHARSTWNDESSERLSSEIPNVRAGLFQTASGKEVSVSKASLSHAKSLWEGDCSSDFGEKEPGKGYCMFQTALGKTVDVSKASLSHAKSLWEGDCSSDLGEKEPDKGSCMFQTALGKTVDVSDTSLSHARSTWNDESSEYTGVEITKTKTGLFQTASGVEITNTKTGLFQTALGKDVTVSNASLSDAKFLWEGDLSSDITDKEPGNQPCMFQTALGSTVNVSETALHRAKSLWNENDEPSVNPTNNSDKSGLFKTAAGKSVDVSHKALAHAKQVLRDENVPLSVDNSRHSGVFQTSSGKCVDVSDESLSHVSNMFDENSTCNISTVAEKKNLNPFQTASGNTVTISEASLKHTKKMFEDIETNSCVVNTLFETASGNDVIINREALQHTQCRLNEHPRCESEKTSDNNVEILHQNGIKLQKKESVSTGNLFQTASGKNVCVSETALNYARSSTNNEVNKNNVNTSSPDYISVSDGNAKTSNHLTSGIAENKHGMPKGFQSASGNIVNVTEKALKHAVKFMSGDKTLDSTSNFSDCHDLSNFEVSESKTTDSLSCVQNVSASCKGGLPLSHVRRRDGYSASVSSVSSCNNNSSKQKQCENREQSDRRVMDSRTSEERSLKCSSDQIAHSSFTEKSSARLTHGKQKVIRKAALQSTPEVFHTDRWSGKGKHFVPLYSKSLSERSSEYTLESIVGKPEPASAPSSFKNPCKKSVLPEAEKPCEKPSIKKTKTHIFCPKAAIKQAQSSSMETVLPAVSSESEISSTKTSSDVTEQHSIAEVCHFVEARKKQDEIILSKKKEKVRPSCGRMFEVKSNCCGYKYSNLCLQTGISQQKLINSGILSSTINLSIKTSQDYRFQLRHFYPNLSSHILVGDGAFLVADDNGFAGTQEFYNGFLTIKGVDPALVTDVWVTNHYKWIVWKLAAYELTFPHPLGGRSLTPDRVMLQLKYRYDREIDNCQRSCLKKITERDDTACKRMILCVAGLVTITREPSETKQHTRNEETFLELTDGWYSIKGKLDGALSELVDRQQIVVGQKLCISGAELGGSEDACPPLEAPASLFLKLSMNSTRPASWDSKLGYQRDPRPLCVAVVSLHSSGGVAGCVDAVVLRVYPVMYMEKVEDSTPIFRTAEAEERVQRQFDQKKQDKMEKLYDKMQAQFEQEESRGHRRSRRNLGKQDLENLQTGQEICEAVESSLQPEELHSRLSVEQQQQMEEYQRRRRDERQQEMQEQFQKTWDETHGTETNRNVTPVMKIRVAGCARRDIDSKTSTIVTIWRPSPDWMEIKEGKRYMFFSLIASTAKTRLSSHSVHLTASRQSYCKEQLIDENYLDLVYEPREVWRVRDLRCRTPPNKEFDFVGITVEVSSNSDKRLDTVYVADVDGELVGIRFWGGIQSFGISDLLQEGKMFVGQNLVLKWSRGRDVVTVDACMEVSHFSHTSSSQEQRKCLDKLKSVVQTEVKQFLNRAKVKLSNLQTLQPVYTPESKQSMAIPGHGFKQPVTPSAQENIDMEFLDNLPPECVQRLFSPMDENGNSQKQSTAEDDLIKKQKSAIRSKVSKLLAYGSPKTLSPLNTTMSPAAFQRFKPPNLVKNLSSILE